MPLGFGPDGIEGTGDDATLPEGDFTEQFEYDERGRQTLHVSFEGAVTQSVYDASTGRLAERRFFDNLTAYDNGNGTPAEVWEYTYDAFGRVVEIDQPSRTVTREYDAQGRLIVESTLEGVLGYTYDNLGRLTQTAVYLAGDDPSIDTPQRTTTYTYDALGRLETVVEDRDAAVGTDALLTTTYTYDLLGNLDSTLLPNGVIEDYEYDSLNRLDTLTTFLDDGTASGEYDAGDTLIASYDYTVRDDGRRTGLTETFSTGLTNTYTWDYDNLGRLTSETLDSSDNSLDFVTTYEFDLTGNRLEKSTAGGETITYEYDDNDRLLEETSSTGVVTTYDYDVTQQTEKTVTQTDDSSVKTIYEYDLQGRMSAVVTEVRDDQQTLQSRTRVEYDYDDRGLRVESRELTDTNLDGSFDRLDATTKYLVDHDNHTGYQQVIRETRTDEQTGESTVIDYSFGHDEITQTTRQYDDQGAQVSDETLTFTHDGSGSVRALLNAVGAIASIVSIEQIFILDAYGNLLNITISQAGTSVLGDGEAFDIRTGLYNHRTRWLDPLTGRWNRLDDFFGNHWDPQSFHKALFVHADPINGIDPTGMSLLAGFGGSVIGAHLNGIDGNTSLKVMESLVAVAAGATVGQALAAAVVLDTILLGLPIAGTAIRSFADTFIQNLPKFAKKLPVVKNGNRLTLIMPGVGHIGKMDDLLDEAFDANRALNNGSSQTLARQLERVNDLPYEGLRGMNVQAHHVVPKEYMLARRHSLLDDLDFNIDSALNGIPLENKYHFGSHSNYNNAWQEILDRIDTAPVSLIEKQ